MTDVQAVPPPPDAITAAAAWLAEFEYGEDYIEASCIDIATGMLTAAAPAIAAQAAAAERERFVSPASYLFGLIDGMHKVDGLNGDGWKYLVESFDNLAKEVADLLEGPADE